MLNLGCTSCFCAASVVPLSHSQGPTFNVPLLTALGTRVRARLGIGLHVRRLRRLFCLQSQFSSKDLMRPRSHYSGGDAEKRTDLHCASCVSAM